MKRTAVPFSALLSALRKSKVALLLAVYFLFFIAFVFLQSTLSPWLQTVFGFGALQTGLVFFLIGAINVATQAVLLPMLNKKFSRPALTILGIAFFIAGLLVLSAASNLAILIVFAAVVAFGFGLQYVTVNTLISLNSPENAQGGALGIAWAIAGAAQSVAPVLAASAFNFGLSIGFVGLAFLVSALVSLATVPLVWSFRKASKKSS